MPEPKQLRLAYLYDPDLHAAANGAGRNYWDVYIREILDQLGLRGEEISCEALEDAEQLSPYATLLIGNLPRCGATVKENLHQWVRGGGTLIAFATEGLHDLFGNRCVGRVRQPNDEFTCAATFALKPHPLTREIHSPLQPKQRLLIFSEALKVQSEESVELARLYGVRQVINLPHNRAGQVDNWPHNRAGQVDNLPHAGRDTGGAAVTARRVGKGRAFYFAFSVPQTMWGLHQGRPIDRDYDGDNYLRRSDAIVIRPHSIEVAYADEILFLLQNMIGAQPHPFIHQLPPTPDGNVPDALFFWGGDDEGDIAGIQLRASNWMKERGLPYHINAMPRSDGKFGLRLEDAQKIWANGHEISLHFNYIDNFPQGAGFTREDVLAQAAAYRQHFGADWVCSVNHWCRWTGWAEPAHWMREAGGKADNSFVHSSSPPPNPVNLLGFSFGTAFPFWFYDDWRNGNQRIDFLEEPITAYECGYVGKEGTDFDTVHKVIDFAARYHLTMNLFYHPVYIADYPACRLAIEEGLRYLKARKIRALHVGNDELYRWWKARSEAQVTEPRASASEIALQATCDYPSGMVIKIPLGRRRAARATVNGKRAKCVNEQKFGQNWGLVVVRGKGEVRVKIE